MEKDRVREPVCCQEIVAVYCKKVSKWCNHQRSECNVKIISLQISMSEYLRGLWHSIYAHSACVLLNEWIKYIGILRFKTFYSESQWGPTPHVFMRVSRWWYKCNFFRRTIPKTFSESTGKVQNKLQSRTICVLKLASVTLMQPKP